MILTILNRWHTKICIFTLLLTLCMSKESIAIYDKIAINITPQENEIQLCFDFDTKSYLASDNTSYLDKSYLIGITDNSDVFFISNGVEGLEVFPWQPDVEPPPFLLWTPKKDPFCFPMLNKDALKPFDLYCAVGTSFSDAIAANRYIRFFDGSFPTLPQPKKEWTVMVYMVGSNLEPEGLKDKKNASKDIVEMINGSSNIKLDNFNIALTTGGSLRYGWDTVKRSWIHQGQQYVLENTPAASMTEPETLESFVLWSVKNFPAEHYALILWDHGGGAVGFGANPEGKIESDKDTLGLDELQQVYQNIRNSMGRTLDIVVYDACLMASLEVLQISSVVADAMSASAENVPGHGIDYNYLINGLSANKISSGIEFGKLAKDSYIQQCKEEDEFDRNINGIPYKGITSSVFDLTQMPQFKKDIETFSLAFKSSMESGSYSSYEAASVGMIKALGYPFKQASQYRSLSDNHIRIDFGGFLYNLKSRLPVINSEIELVQSAMQKLVADYEGNVANIDQNSGAHSGRFSIDIGKETGYLKALPEYFTNISDGIIAYKKRREEDNFKPGSRLVCEEGVVCADFPNWLELSSGDTFGLTIYTGWSDDDNTFQISKIETVKVEEELSSDMTILLPLEDICSYLLCVNSSDCQAVTVKKINGLMLAEAIVNGVNSIVTFCPQNDNEWSVCSVVGNSNDIWGREESLYSEDVIKTIVVKKSDDKIETTESAMLAVDNPNQVLLKKDCSVSDKTIHITFYGLNQETHEVKLCRGSECQNSGIIIKQ
ncbi:MAG: hypothetical protein HQK70_08010 [Desulfamplus sp.]|nr:hypothetical protein [Desulfamplus sp.]